jgi:hypothetical protein
MFGKLARLEVGGGRVRAEDVSARLTIPPRKQGYANAQLDDYHELGRGNLPWRPPLTFGVTARAFSPSPTGTLGFGLWNDPFSVSLGGGGMARRLPAAPQAAWFFYGSAPNDLSLGRQQPGQGWMAMTLRSRRVPAALLAAPASAALLLARIPPLRRPLFRLMERAISVESAALDTPLDHWHEYRLEWRAEAVEFKVDGHPVLRSGIAPREPLGLVLWIDNQFLCASPASGLRFGLIPTDCEQWLELADFYIRPND